MAEDPLIIPIRFDTSGAEQDLNQLEERAKRGVTAPVRTEGEGGARRRGGTTPLPSPTGVAALQSDIDAAVERGDMRAAQRMAATARGHGIDVSVPTESVGGARSRFTQPIVSQGQQIRERALAWSEEFDRRERVRMEQLGVVPGASPRGQYGPPRPLGYEDPTEKRGREMRERAFAHADEFERRNRERDDRGRSIRERAMGWAEEFERREQVSLTRMGTTPGGARGRFGPDLPAGFRREGGVSVSPEDQNERRFLRNLDAANLQLQKAREREAAAASKNAELEERRSRQMLRGDATSGFQADIAGLSPTEQRRRINERVEMLGASGVMTREDMSEQMALQRQSNALRKKTGWNREVLGMGNYFSVLFGGWEVAQLYQAQKMARLQASVAGSDIERMNIMAEAASGKSGIIGSIVSQLYNVAGWVAPLDTPEKLAESALLETSRRGSLDAVNQNVFRRGNERAMMSAAGRGDYAAKMEEARIRQSERHREATALYRQRDTQLKASEPWYWFGVGPKGGSVLALRDEGVRSAFMSEQKDAVEEMKIADAERAVTEQRLTREHRRSLQLARIDTARIGAFLGGDPEANLRAMREQHGIAEEEARRMFGGASDELATLRDQNTAARRVEERNIAAAQRASIAEISRLRGETEASRLGREGQPLAAAQERIRAQFAFAKAGLNRLDPNYDQMSGALGEAQTEAMLVAERVESQRTIMANATSVAAGLQLSRQPFMARIAGIRGARDAAIAGGLPSGEANRAMIDQIFAEMQGRADQAELININQRGRQRQLDAFLARDPTSANVAGIVARTRGEEAQLRQAGFPFQADEAREIGMKELRLERQQYLDAFRGVQVDRDFPFSLQPRDAEDPATVLKNIEDGIRDLEQPGMGGGDAVGVLKGIFDQMKALNDRLGAALTN